MIKKRLIVGVTGATGVEYARKMLELLRPTDIEVHLVISNAARLTMRKETSFGPDDLIHMADVYHEVNNIGASIASGSFKTEGMIIVPCSVRTLSEIACGTTSTLMTRAADVVLKERRRLVLVFRETPLHIGHLESMRKVTLMGGIIAPPVPAMYIQPQSVSELVTYSVVRILDLFDISTVDVNRWAG